jgi:hypothetical protein
MNVRRSLRGEHAVPSSAEKEGGAAGREGEAADRREEWKTDGGCLLLLRAERGKNSRREDSTLVSYYFY